MSRNRRWIWLPIVLASTTPAPASAQHHHGGMMTPVAFHGHGHGGHEGMGGPFFGGPGLVGSGFATGIVSGGFYGGIYGGGGYLLGPQSYQFGFAGVAPAVPLTAPNFFVAGQVPGQGLGQGGGGGGGGLMMPMPPQALQGARVQTASRRRPSPSRARELIAIADRSFRANDTHRADERLQQAAKADPTNPTPHLHLSQVSIVRGDYKAAADHLRTAVGVARDRGWLLNAPDIQSIYAEPADFAKQLAKLESHLQANPNDRDAWFVLGAQWYFSGRTQQSADVFQRLTDRRPDEALAAFLDASTPELRNPR